MIRRILFTAINLIGGLLVISAAAGAGAFVLLLDHLQRPATEASALAAKAAAHAIADHSMPEGFAALSGISGLGGNVAIFENKFAQTRIMLSQTGAPTLLPASASALAQRVLEQQDSRITWTVLASETRQVRGRPAELLRMRGTAPDGRDMTGLLLTFRGKSGNALLLIAGEQSLWSAVDGERLIASLR